MSGEEVPVGQAASVGDGGDPAADPGQGAPPAGASADMRPARIGLGLLVSVVVGWGPLTDAMGGHGSFEAALLRYLVCLAVSVGAVLLLGRLLDGAPPPETEEVPGGGEERQPVPDDRRA